MKRGITRMAMVMGSTMFMSTIAVAQPMVNSDVIGCGGTAMTGSGRALVGTVGQAVIGPTASPALSDLQGFWYGVAQGVGPAGVVVTTMSDHPVQVLPNPLASTGTVMLTLTSRCHTTLRIIDMLGREVARLLDGPHGPGTERIVCDVGQLPAGRYTLVLSGTGIPVHADLMIVR